MGKKAEEAKKTTEDAKKAEEAEFAKRLDELVQMVILQNADTICTAEELLRVLNKIGQDNDDTRLMSLKLDECVGLFAKYNTPQTPPSADHSPSNPTKKHEFHF